MILGFLENLFSQLVLWEKILALLVAGGTSLWIIMRFLKSIYRNIKEANKSLSEFLDAIPEITKMTKEFGSNGNSLKDVLSRLENNLSHTDQKIKVIASCLGIAVFEADKNGLYIFMSKKWSEITGTTFEEALGNGWLNIIHEDERNEIYKEWMSCIEQNREFHAIVKLSKSPFKEVTIVAWPIRNKNHTIENFFGILL